MGVEDEVVVVKMVVLDVVIKLILIKTTYIVLIVGEICILGKYVWIWLGDQIKVQLHIRLNQKHGTPTSSTKSAAGKGSFSDGRSDLRHRL